MLHCPFVFSTDDRQDVKRIGFGWNMAALPVPFFWIWLTRCTQHSCSHQLSHSNISNISNILETVGTVVPAQLLSSVESFICEELIIVERGHIGHTHNITFCLFSIAPVSTHYCQCHSQCASKLVE